MTESLRDKIMMAALTGLALKKNTGDASKSSHEAHIKSIVTEAYEIADEAMRQKSNWENGHGL